MIGGCLLEYRSAEGVTEAKERGFERNGLGWEVRRRKAVRLNWNLGNGQLKCVLSQRIYSHCAGNRPVNRSGRDVGRL